MRVEWLYEARCEFRDFLTCCKASLRSQYARRFSDKELGQVQHLADFPEIGVLRKETLMGRHGFRALFIDQYVYIYKLEGDIILVHHLADTKKSYIYQIFEVE